MGRFRVGDVCIGQNMVIFPEYNGVECVVLSELSDIPRYCPRRRIMASDGPRQLVRWADGAKSWQRPITLRLRRPPSWDQWITDTRDVERELRGVQGVDWEWKERA